MSETRPIQPAIILVRPREEGNIGSVARAMANTGLSQLILVEPAPMLGGTAQGFGVGGWHILEACQRTPSLQSAIADFQRVIGTSSGRDRPFRQMPVVFARDLPAHLTQDPPGTRTALVFGPEDTGLSRAELELCHTLTTVPCFPSSPTLNLSQAVLIVAYEIFLATTNPATDRVSERESPATGAEITTLLEHSDTLLRQIGYDQDTIRNGWLRELRSLLLRGSVSSQETRKLWRLLNRLFKVIRSGQAPESGG